MDLQRAQADGEQFIKNAEEEMDRKILREDQLYFIENQVEAIDTYLADTEELAAADPKLKDTRDKLRGLKTSLEKKNIEFLALQEGADLPEDLPPAETAADLVVAGKEFIEMVDAAMKAKVQKIDQVAQWEDPLVIVNSFLADSEIYAVHHPELPKLRTALKSRKADLEKRIKDVVSAWRAADMAGGADDDDS